MAAINYKTSDFITLATKAYHATHEDAVEQLNDYGYTDKDIEDMNLDDFISELYRDYEEADYFNTEEVINRYDFTYFNIVIMAGYYEGLQVDIELNDYGLWTTGYEEDFIDSITEAIDEIETLKKLMIELTWIGLKACNPGWSTGWYSLDETLEQIDIACENIKNDLLELEY